MMSIRIFGKQARLQRLQSLMKLRYHQSQIHFIPAKSPPPKKNTASTSPPKISTFQTTFFSKPALSPAPAPLVEQAPRAKKRKKSAYKDNVTAALGLPCTADELEKINSRDLLEKSKPLIVEHASRRVDLFFYTLVAYYNTKTRPKQGHTFLQHGSGRNLLNNRNITQGCHSSYLPALVDASHGASHPDEGLLSGTHFMDSLNATVELPPYVNELDNELENDCTGRRKCLEILNRVAQGVIDPLNGLTEFLKSMSQLFKEIEANPLRIEKFYCKHRMLTPELIKAVQQGTLAGKFSTVRKEATRDYIDLLLRLTPEEKAAGEKDPEVRAEIQLKKMKELQNEILTTKTTFAPG